MEEWKEYRLGDICDTISDTYKGNSPQVVLINTSDVLEGKCLNHIPVPNKNLKGQFKKTFCNEDILYSEIRPANKRFAYIDFEPKDYIASTKLMVIRSKEEVLPKYLYYILQSNQMLDKLQTLAETRSGTFPQITFSELAAQKIILPGLNSQKKIVQVLESINSKIELNRRINENLEQQAQALFKSWFVDFEPFKDGKFVDSELGMIPEGWRINLVKDIAIFTQGTQVPVSMQYNTQKENMIRFIRIVDYTSNNTELPRFIYKTNKQTECDESDVIMVRYGNIGTIGRRLTGVIANNLFKISPSNILTKNFLYYFFKQKEIQELIVASAAGSAMPAIKHSTIGNINIIVPPKGVVNMFDLICNSYEAQILKNNQENSYLKEVRDTLLPKLMSGELAITDVDDRSIFQ